jgi:hypothetical protein
LTNCAATVTTAALTLVRPFTDAFCFSIDFDKEFVDAKLYFPSLNLMGKYEAAGRILVVPLTGNGDMNITLGNTPNTFSGALCW